MQIAKQAKIVPIVSIVVKTSASKKRKKTGNVVIWSFGHLVILTFFKENKMKRGNKRKN